MTNYFDKQGNYINCENLSLAEIYHRAFALGVDSTPIEGKRPQGEWEHWGSPFSDEQVANSIVCSVCGARFVEIQDEVFNFCPNCGADMKGE